MKGKKIVFGLVILSFLSACTSPTAILGPAYTLSTTGNVLQASISYGSNEMITAYTGKTPLENIKEIAFTNKKNVKKNTIESKEFYNLVKKNIKKTNKIIQLINQ